VVVVGDSVGKTLVRNAPADLAGTLTITSGAIEGCGLVDGKIRTAARWRVSFDRCGDIPTRWSEAAAAARAEVVLVTVGAWEVFDLTRDAGNLDFGTDAWKAYFTPRLTAAVDALIATGAHVALLEVPCFRPVDGGGLKALPERGDDTRTALLNDLMRAEAQRDPVHITFVSGPAGFCADPATAHDLNLRWDGVHYYRPGAALVWETITPALLTLSVPPGT
jgi:hypothetical protein